MENEKTLIQSGTKIPEVVDPRDLGWLGQALREGYATYGDRLLFVQPLDRIVNLGPISWGHQNFPRNMQIRVYQGTSPAALPSILREGIVSIPRRSTVALDPETHFPLLYAMQGAIFAEQLNVDIGIIVASTALGKEIAIIKGSYADAFIKKRHPDPERVRALTTNIPDFVGHRKFVYLPPERIVGLYVVLFDPLSHQQITDFRKFIL